MHMNTHCQLSRRTMVPVDERGDITVIVQFNSHNVIASFLLLDR